MDNIKLVPDKKKCCGCGACANICPKGAITMVEDEYGFIYPQIDQEKCINCGMCLKTCAYKKDVVEVSNQKAFMAVCKNKDILMNSASGGVFISIAQEFIKNNGVVYGCAMLKNENNELNPQHIKATNLEDLKKIQGSKYVQSQTGFIYKDVKNELLNNKKVLFTGTPCQVSALKSFLGKLSENENLYTIDIICHGVPNSKMFKDYIKFIEKKYNDKVEDFLFRDKKKGWGYFSKVSFKNNIINIPCINSSYYQLFLDSIICRENCYSCPYANSSRVGDLTIGDFWGIEKEYSKVLDMNNIDSEKGISCILVNNDNGEKLIRNYSNQMFTQKVDVDKVFSYNHQLCNPSKYNPKREEALEVYQKEGYAFLDQWYKKYKGYKYYIKSVWYRLPYKIRKRIKK